MKVLVINQKGLLGAVGNQMNLEGDEVVISREVPEGASSYDLVLTDTEVNIPGAVGGDINFPSASISAMGVNYIQKDFPDFFLAKYYDRFEGWGRQLLIGFPLVGMMNGNLGLKVNTGVGLRYIPEDSQLGELFKTSLLERTLKEMGYTGFVSIGVVHGEPLGVSCITAGLLYGSIFPVLEGCRGRISDFFCGEEKLLESWVVGVLVTRPQFPYKVSADRCFLKGLSENMLKHLWMPFVVSHRNSHYTDSTIIGYSTAWSQYLGEACSRSLRTCNALRLEEKQYRMDIKDQIQSAWVKVLPLLEKITPGLEQNTLSLDQSCVETETDSEDQSVLVPEQECTNA